MKIQNSLFKMIPSTLLLLSVGALAGTTNTQCPGTLTPDLGIATRIMEIRASSINQDESSTSIEEEILKMDVVMALAKAELKKYLHDQATVFDSVSERAVYRGKVHYLTVADAEKLKGRTVAFISYLEPTMTSEEGARFVLGKVVDVIRQHISNDPDGMGGQVSVYEPSLVLENRNPSVRPLIWMRKLLSPVYLLD